MQGLHVVQPVGQLHQQDADVLGHRDQQLAEILRVLGLLRLEFEPAQLGDAVDKVGDFLAEQGLDIFQRRIGVLHHVVEQRCDRSEEHTSELQSLMRISYAVFCLKKKNTQQY